MKKFLNQTVIVSGGATGLGRSLVQAYLSEGANVVICGRREQILKEAVKDLILTEKKYKDRIISIKTDMSVEEQVVNLFDQAKEKFSSVNIMVNNAGSWSELPLADCNSREIDLMFNNNLRSTILGTKIAGMNLLCGGSIINFGSYSGIISIKSASLYSTFKAAVSHFTRSAASELAEKGIRVNCVIPGVIKTPMTEQYISDHFDRLIEPISLKRLGTPEEVADGVIFLSSENASYITGISLEITGGKYLTQV
tara:strand:- start:482 stop:1240 length:759 start_codon:yes stop_codon:yes gene_type:complete